MKLRIQSALLLVTLVLSMLLMSSCYLIGQEGGGGLGLWTPDEEPAGGNITVNGGNNYEININGSSGENVLAASKALLSSVSIICSFERYALSGSQSGNKETYYTAGSGVIYQLDKERGNAYIITNYHVIYNRDAMTQDKISRGINVYLYGKEFSDYAIEAEFVGGSMLYDLAVLEVKGSEVLMESEARAADVANSNDVSILETAIAIGNPEGKGISATVGVVNVDSEEIEMKAADEQTVMSLRVIRTDAAVNHGNSGGGLFNTKGELIGIVNAKVAANDVDNIGYAIPSNVAKSIADNILYYCKDSANDCVRRVILGINVSTTGAYTYYDKDTGKIHKYDEVVVVSIEENSSVKGILEADDIIEKITIDGVTYDINRVFHVVDSMLNARPGSTVVMHIKRDGVAKDVSLSITSSMLVDYK